jgi:hypothetical protein
MRCVLANQNPSEDGTFNIIVMIINARPLSRFPSSGSGEKFDILFGPGGDPRPQDPISPRIAAETGVKQPRDQNPGPISLNLDETVKFYAKSPFDQVDTPRGFTPRRD